MMQVVLGDIGIGIVAIAFIAWVVLCILRALRAGDNHDRYS